MYLHKHFLRLSLLLLVLLMTMFFSNHSQALPPEFDRAYVISDQEFNDKEAMTLNEIRDFLNEQPGPLKDIFVHGRPAYRWIYDVSQRRNINPKLILAKLEVEQSLITRRNYILHGVPVRLEERLKCALGCGVSLKWKNGMWVCSQVYRKIDFRGFHNQVGCAGYTFRHWYDDAPYPFTVRTYDEGTFNVVNRATYSLYKYTPTVSDKRLLVRVWRQFFESGHPKCSGGFRAEYFSNMHLAGSPVYTRCESRIDHDWGGGSPGHGVPSDHFSARWEGRFHFDSGRYRFIARTDDGIRVWVDGRRVIDAWWDQPPTVHRGEISLSQGEHTVKVEWYENGGGAVAQVRWERIRTQDPHCGDRTEPNNSYNQGYWLQPGQRVEGYICPQNDIDWFRFTVNSGDEVRIRLQSLPADYDMVLYVNNQEVANSDRGGTSDEEIVWRARGVGNGTRAYIKVYGWNGAWSRNDSYVISLEKHQSGGGASCPNQYKAEYFNNRDLRGSPVLVRCEGWPIRHDWGGGSPGPGVSSDNFSARWTGRAHISDGVYTFIARADDGIRVWLNGQILINQWKDQPPTEYRSVRRVPSGDYHIRVEYYEHGGGAVAQFRWERGVHGGPGGYTFCANEGERCSFSGTKDVAYGANGHYTVRHGVRGGIDCNNSVFGDPSPGVFKACYVKETGSGGGGGGGNTGGPTYEIVAKHSGKCLDVEGARPDNGTNVQQWACGGGPNQRWRLVDKGGGYYEIVAVHSGKCLDVARGSLDDGANVIQWQCHGGDNQLWRIERVGDAYRIIVKHSGKALDVEGAKPQDGANVQVWRYGGGPNQLWWIRRR